jgi:hypothetical protein
MLRKNALLMPSKPWALKHDRHGNTQQDAMWFSTGISELRRSVPNITIVSV